MKRTYRYDRATRKLVEVTRPERVVSHEVMPDVSPYRSIITGETIGGRAQHREHLKRHDCVEVGSEMPKVGPWQPDRESIKDSIREAKRALEWGEVPTLNQLHDMRPQAMKEMGLSDD